jgi:hypothetical protein
MVMANQVTFSKDQIAIAKEKGMPLTAIAFDDRHLTKEQGGKVGRMTMVGPTSSRKAKKLMDFMLVLLKEKD